ncbi:hypothetical protein A2914_00500 [Candidatus Nomurabacteria bacterium RIFCSPLOWO2_01_FULL_41_21]|uniref:DUF5673 domain-containing protein n=2 Tax=Candidatus Nomuraibacteriota TaxID=1752729 RepID=A0A1F6V404_9BACT|nr:MAG: hypothetical protein A2733_02860 [Candidatus Nomurabacteria bacterium RIFCSPHIGHO2_01_FULL_40_20]OGI88324.1 MAG: hypothetical protein A2914_00500 [Candidatus Nomurabacteria bacterium RIFCSPLOWO2_01_FULL_41_21]
MEENKITWSAFEYEHKEKNNDWFWALGIIIVAGALTSLIYGNYFFAMLLIIGGVLMGYFAKKAPGITDYELNEKGFKIKNRLFPYESIKSFWVQVDSEKNLKPTLFIRSSRMFMPILSVPIEPYHGEKIRAMILAHNIAEEEIKEHPSEKIMDALGF